MNSVKRTFALGFPWQTQDPFLFCVHHEDFYPRGNDVMGPAASLAGRSLGNDFVVKDGWRMYHGEKVPGFPAHPHRGFETVTIATKGLIDHSDSLGAAGRFGNGDVQWMTAGKGVQHCEMFPLLSREHENPLELFQIWLNLPRAGKLVNPHFSMLWNERVPTVTFSDDAGRKTEVKLVAGTLASAQALAPPPDSWAADPNHQVAIWLIRLDAHAQWSIPAVETRVNRSLYFYRGVSVQVDERPLTGFAGLELDASRSTELVNGAEPAWLLMLQGQPIAEPVAQYGPFVMNTHAEIQQAMADYQSTQFGGWPWPTYEHVHPREKGRFARYPNGVEETPAS